MADGDKLEILKAMVGDTDSDVILTAYLKLAGQKILARAFPYDESQTNVPEKYETLQCEIAAYLLNKRGAEGQKAHSENGINRIYENADVPESMLRVIVPKCGVIK